MSELTPKNEAVDDPDGDDEYGEEDKHRNQLKRTEELWFVIEETEEGELLCGKWLAIPQRQDIKEVSQIKMYADSPEDLRAILLSDTTRKDMLIFHISAEGVVSEVENFFDSPNGNVGTA